MSNTLYRVEIDPHCNLENIISPPDGITCAVFTPKADNIWLIDTETLDVGLAWRLAGVEVIMEIGFELRNSIPLDQLFAICGGSGFGVSLALPITLDDETSEQWISWNRVAVAAMTAESQRCFVYPAAQYIEWMILNEIESQDLDVVTLPTHEYGKWFAETVTASGLSQRLKGMITQEMERCLGVGWAPSISHKIGQSLFLQPAHAG